MSLSKKLPRDLAASSRKFKIPGELLQKYFYFFFLFLKRAVFLGDPTNAGTNEDNDDNGDVQTLFMQRGKCVVMQKINIIMLTQ